MTGGRCASTAGLASPLVPADSLSSRRPGVPSAGRSLFSIAVACSIAQLQFGRFRLLVGHRVARPRSALRAAPAPPRAWWPVSPAPRRLRQGFVHIPPGEPPAARAPRGAGWYVSGGRLFSNRSSCRRACGNSPNNRKHWISSSAADQASGFFNSCLANSSASSQACVNA